MPQYRSEGPHREEDPGHATDSTRNVVAMRPTLMVFAPHFLTIDTTALIVRAVRWWLRSVEKQAEAAWFRKEERKRKTVFVSFPFSRQSCANGRRG